MSLIITHINKYGIILASDSNLSEPNSNAGFGQKIFPIPHLNSGLAYSGSYTIGGKSADWWIIDFITRSVYLTDTLGEFTQLLCIGLTAEMRDYEIKAATIIHLAGFKKELYESHIEHWHISNTGLNQNGIYDTSHTEFHHENDFSSFRNGIQREMLIKFYKDAFERQLYINGFSPGRVTALIIIKEIEKLMNWVWGNSEWKFRKPASLFETANLLKLNLAYVCELFKMSDYNALYIGGEIQTHLIPAPQDLFKNPGQE